MRTITKNNIHNQYSIYNSHKMDKGSYQEILQSIDDLLTTMTNRHNKVLFIRFDLTYPQNNSYPNDNALLSRFIETLQLHCKRRQLDPHYLWVREQASSDHHHYHFIFLLNGNKIQNPYGFFNKATDLWGKCLNVDTSGLVHYGTNLMIRRNSPEFNLTLQGCFTGASYLAKAYSKGNAPPGVREMGMSNISKWLFN